VTNERLGALAALVVVLAVAAFCVWLLIKLGTWVVVQFYGHRLGVEQQRVFAKPRPTTSTDADESDDGLG